MKCAFCGLVFDKEASQACCRGCPMSGGGCRMVRCPNCGYETPVAPEMKRIKSLVRRLFRRGTEKAASGGAASPGK